MCLQVGFKKFQNKNKFIKQLNLLISANNNECIQRNNGILIVINSFTASCNGKTSCRILPSRLNLVDCGGQAASYLHIDYVCALSKISKLDL